MTDRYDYRAFRAANAKGQPTLLELERQQARVDAAVRSIQPSTSIVQPGAVQARPCAPPASGSWAEISGWLEPLVRVWPRPAAYRSKTEGRFVVERLEPWRLDRDGTAVEAWAYEPVEIRIGVGTPSEQCYTPDFILLDAGRLRCLEVKGAWCWDRDRARMKGFCNAMPDLPLEVWKYAKGVWTCERLGGQR